MSERGQMRRRLREQLRVREAMLLDLGALVYELHRQGRRAPALLQRKAAQLTEVDDQVRALQAALDGDEPAPAPPEPIDEAYDTAEVDAYRAEDYEVFEEEDEVAHAERMEERAAAQREEQRILAKLEEDAALAEHEQEHEDAVEVEHEHEEPRA